MESEKRRRNYGSGLWLQWERFPDGTVVRSGNDPETDFKVYIDEDAEIAWESAVALFDE